jgi:hypothetical protein
MKESSKNISVMHNLNKIQRVPAPEHLYARVMTAVKQQVQVVPMSWVRVAAAIALLFLTADIAAVLGSKSTETQTDTLRPNTINYLYE